MSMAGCEYRLTCNSEPQRKSLQLMLRSGGDRPDDVLEQAKVRKAQGFTRVKMNVSYLSSRQVCDSADLQAVESVCFVHISQGDTDHSDPRSSVGSTLHMHLMRRSSDWRRSSPLGWMLGCEWGCSAFTSRHTPSL